MLAGIPFFLEPFFSGQADISWSYKISAFFFICSHFSESRSIVVVQVETK